jgi:hypothetical protein
VTTHTGTKPEAQSSTDLSAQTSSTADTETKIQTPADLCANACTEAAAELLANEATGTEPAPTGGTTGAEARREVTPTGLEATPSGSETCTGLTSGRSECTPAGLPTEPTPGPRKPAVGGIP